MQYIRTLLDLAGSVKKYKYSTRRLVQYLHLVALAGSCTEVQECTSTYGLGSLLLQL